MILGGEVGRVERDAEVGGATFPRSDGDGKRRTSAAAEYFVLVRTRGVILQVLDHL